MLKPGRMNDDVACSPWHVKNIPRKIQGKAVGRVGLRQHC
jgi:hypothetical protein